MKLQKHLSVLTVITLFFCSCVKDVFNGVSLSSIVVTNAIVGSPSLKVGSNTSSIARNRAVEFAVISGNNDLYIWPDGDSSHPVFKRGVQTTPNHIYSLFLTGQLSGEIDPLWVEEHLPLHNDSTTGIRFIHLSPFTPPVSIKLIDKEQNEFSDVEYKEKTEFMTYPAKMENTFYNFVIYDTQTGDTLGIYSYQPAKFKNVTIAITNLAAEDPSINFTRINHY